MVFTVCLKLPANRNSCLYRPSHKHWTIFFAIELSHEFVSRWGSFYKIQFVRGWFKLGVFRFLMWSSLFIESSAPFDAEFAMNKVIRLCLHIDSRLFHFSSIFFSLAFRRFYDENENFRKTFQLKFCDFLHSIRQSRCTTHFTEDRLFLFGCNTAASIRAQSHWFECVEKIAIEPNKDNEIRAKCSIISATRFHVQ